MLMCQVNAKFRCYVQFGDIFDLNKAAGEQILTEFLAAAGNERFQSLIDNCSDGPEFATKVCDVLSCSEM